ncbi:MAG TPA: hypothetical protein VGR29_05635 [Thermomicrobiales bacterium]|nr:hypothetical protein [Thermomicrobiales bacterium]
MSKMFRLLDASMIAVLGFLGVMLSAGAQGGGTGTVIVLKYYCTYLDETALVEAIEIDQCSPGAATFTFYLVGDGTNDFEQLNVSGAGRGSIELPVGEYEVVEEGSQTHFMVNVLAGTNVQLLIANPSIEVVPTDPAPAPTAVPQPTTVPVEPTVVTAQPSTTRTQPTRLPNTGSGSDVEPGVVAFALTAAALVAGSGAMILGKTRRD